MNGVEAELNDKPLQHQQQPKASLRRQETLRDKARRKCTQLYLDIYQPKIDMDDEASPLSPSEQGVVGGEGDYGMYGTYNTWVRPCLAELIGTTIFIYLLLMCSEGGQTAPIGAGFTLFIVICCVGHISGAHVNPAVTLGVLLCGEIKPILAIFYFIIHILSSLVSSLLYRVSVGHHVYNETLGGNTVLGQFGVELADGTMHHTEIGQAIIIEMLLTSLLVLAVQTTALDSCSKNLLAPLAIGFTISACASIDSKLTGCSLNPARSFGPALMWSLIGPSSKVDVWEGHYVYWAGPMLGAVLATIMYRLVLASPDTNIIHMIQKRRGL